MKHTDKFMLAGVLGWPVMHSRSPLIHNHWFQTLGLPGAYVPLAIPAAGLAAALRALPALGFAGVNVTIPHKQAALAIVFLPHQAWTAADAIVRTVHRLLVSRRLLLDWHSASRVERISASISWTGTNEGLVASCAGCRKILNTRPADALEE